MSVELTQELRNGIWKWYPFQENAEILHLGNSSCAELDGTQQYDYIVAIHVLEFAKDPVIFLEKCKDSLKPNGKLLLAVDNRLGIRYFCGDRDVFTNRNFDGIENYRRVSVLDRDKQAGIAFDKATVESFLEEAGFSYRQCFSVLPSVDAPQLLYAQDYLPEEELSIRYFPYYNHPDTVFLEEAYLYDGLVKNGLFHAMANGYFYECAFMEQECATRGIKHITLSMDRGRNAAMATMICKNDTVMKKAMYSEGIDGLYQLQKNHADLKARGISVVEGNVEQDTYTMPYIKAEIGTKYLQELLRRDKDAFVREIDSFRDIILQSSQHVEPALSEYERKEHPEIEESIWLEKGYFDLVPLNAFYLEKGWVFFDQEFVLEKYPANAIIVRMIDIVYGGFADLEAILPRSFFWERYNMDKQVAYLRKKSHEFLISLRNQKQLRGFNEAHHVNYEQVHSNRQRMNFSAEEYQQLFVNIFEDLDKYKLFLFGSGNFAKKFVDLYGDKYTIEAILDNNKDKWGDEIKGISICSPEVLKELNESEFKVIICIKSYLGVWKQLKEAGVENIGIYDTNVIYPAVNTRTRDFSESLAEVAVKEDSLQKKKYHTGYIAGVFDLYHIGHLNMFKRAKEQCEYLIVGVVSDEGVRKNKKTEPFIPFEERIEMIRSCKFVDEAVEIPLSFAGTRDAYRLYHFDVQFSGSDYENDPDWLAEREFLRKHGADMVFFPYTEQTSSTKIKALINKQLEEK